MINRSLMRQGKPYAPATLAEFKLLPGVEQAIVALRKAGFLIIIVTNQPDVAMDTQRREITEAMHDRLHASGLYDEIKVCYHSDMDTCDCRKPKPGMLIEAAKEWQIDLANSYMVGDRWRDIEAGKAAGCTTFFIDYNYQERRPKDPDAIVTSLEEASKFILKKAQVGGEQVS